MSDHANTQGEAQDQEDDTQRGYKASQTKTRIPTWAAPYAFPPNLPGSFAHEVMCLTPGALDKDRIGDMVKQSLSLEMPHTIAALSGYAALCPDLFAQVVYLCGRGALDVADTPIWIECQTDWLLDYLDMLEDRPDDTIMAKYQDLKRTGYLYFATEEKPGLVGIAFACTASKHVGERSSMNNKATNGLAFMPFVAYVNIGKLEHVVLSAFAPTRKDAFLGRSHSIPAGGLEALRDLFLECVQIAEMPDIAEDARILNEWSDADVATYSRQATATVLNETFRAAAALVLIQIPDAEAGLPGHICYRAEKNDGGVSLTPYWQRGRTLLGRPMEKIPPRTVVAGPGVTGQSVVLPQIFRE